MWAGNLVTARLLARKGIVYPTDFNSIIAKKLEGEGSGGGGGGSADDPYTWEGVAYNIKNGTYRDVYSIGDSVPLDLGSEGLINMQIAAFDTDVLADGSGTAAISWVAKELLVTGVAMGDSGSPHDISWETCNVRSYLNSTVKNLIPSEVRNNIVAVHKTHNASSASVSSVTQTTSDELWIPSDKEVYTNAIYSEIYKDDESRIKFKANNSSDVVIWWARDRYKYSTNYKNNFRVFNKAGWYSYGSPSNAYGVCLGFCTGKSK